MSSRLAREYVRWRLKGKGAREAARRAGFRAGVPSAGARYLWKVTETVQEVQGLEAAAARESKDMRQRVRHLRASARTHAAIREAKELLEEFQEA